MVIISSIIEAAVPVSQNNVRIALGATREGREKSCLQRFGERRLAARNHEKATSCLPIAAMHRRRPSRTARQRSGHREAMPFFLYAALSNNQKREALIKRQ